MDLSIKEITETESALEAKIKADNEVLAGLKNLRSTAEKDLTSYQEKVNHLFQLRVEVNQLSEKMENLRSDIKAKTEAMTKIAAELSQNRAAAQVVKLLIRAKST